MKSINSITHSNRKASNIIVIANGIMGKKYHSLLPPYLTLNKRKKRCILCSKCHANGIFTAKMGTTHPMDFFPTCLARRLKSPETPNFTKIIKGILT